MKHSRTTARLGARLGVLVLGGVLLAACDATSSKFIRDGLNATNEKEADRIASPGEIPPGPGAISGKEGSFEILSRGETEDSTDPNKPRRVERRRR